MIAFYGDKKFSDLYNMNRLILNKGGISLWQEVDLEVASAVEIWII